MPIGFLYSLFKSGFSKYCYNIALSIDKLGNVVMSNIFNDVMITKNGYKFGDDRETISSALGKNKIKNSLSKTGILLCKILDFIDDNHCVNAIKYFD